jgi:hypothetical protein
MTYEKPDKPLTYTPSYNHQDNDNQYSWLNRFGEGWNTFTGHTHTHEKENATDRYWKQRAKEEAEKQEAKNKPLVKDEKGGIKCGEKYVHYNGELMTIERYTIAKACPCTHTGEWAICECMVDCVECMLLNGGVYC